MSRVFVFYCRDHYPHKGDFPLIYEFDSLEDFKIYFMKKYKHSSTHTQGIVGYNLDMFDLDNINDYTAQTAITVVCYDNFFGKEREKYLANGGSNPSIIGKITSYLRDKEIEKILE